MPANSPLGETIAFLDGELDGVDDEYPIYRHAEMTTKAVRTCS